eukprot:11813220-Ditylum_brightwellii.AAC.1
MEAIMEVIKGQDIQDGDMVYSLVKSLLKGDSSQVFKNEEECQEIKDGPAFTKCLMVVTEHVFCKQAYKRQKNTVSGTRRSNSYQDFLLGVRQFPGRWNSIPVESRVQKE